MSARSQNNTKGRGRALALFLFLVLVFATVVLWRTADTYIGRTVDARFAISSYDVERDITSQYARYLEVLESAKALYGASMGVDRDEYAAFFNAFDLERLYPAFSGISYAQYVPFAEKAAYEEHVRTDVTLNGVGYPDFVLKPEGDREAYMPVTYIYPFNEESTTFGYDLLQNPERSDAILRARDSGFPIISAPVTLLGNSGRRGFIIVVPLYKNGMPTSTITERQAAFQGTLNGIFTLDAFYTEALSHDIEAFPGVSFVLRDSGVPVAEPSIYEVDDEHGLGNHPRMIENDIGVGGRIWRLTVYGNPSYIASEVERTVPAALLIVGTLLSLLISAIVYRLGSERRRAEEIADEMTAKLQESEEEFQAILSNSPTIIYLKDKKLKYIVVNHMFEELFNMTSAQVKGKGDRDFLPADAATPVEANDRSVMEGREARDFEEVIPVDGKDHTYLSIKFPLIDKEGEVYGLGGISTDITDRKRGEDELKAKTEELERLAKMMVGREERMIELKRKLESYGGADNTSL